MESVKKIITNTISDKIKDLEAQKAKITDPKIKSAIDEKIKALNTPINK